MEFKILSKIRKQENGVYKTLYKAGKAINQFSIPAPRWFFKPVHDMHLLAKHCSNNILRVFYYQPMFEAACESCGKNLSFLTANIPLIQGDVQITIGNHCRFHGDGAILGYKLLDSPSLSIGDHTYVGFAAIFNVAKSITIGNNVLISDSCIISDNSGHPIDAVLRRENEPIDATQVRPVVIDDDAWICARSTIMPGVHVGKGSIVGTGAVVTKDVPPRSIVAGNPAVVVKTL